MNSRHLVWMWSWCLVLRILCIVIAYHNCIFYQRRKKGKWLLIWTVEFTVHYGLWMKFPVHIKKTLKMLPNKEKQNACMDWFQQTMNFLVMYHVKFFKHYDFLNSEKTWFGGGDNLTWLPARQPVLFFLICTLIVNNGQWLYHCFKSFPFIVDNGQTWTNLQWHYW